MTYRPCTITRGGTGKHSRYMIRLGVFTSYRIRAYKNSSFN